MIETSIYVGDLRSRVGSRRDVHLELTGIHFKSSLCQVIDSIICDLTLESVTSGIVIHGSIQGNYEAQCSYGLIDIVEPFNVQVNELFEEVRIRDRDELEEDTYKFKGDDLDIDQMLRDSIIPSLPLAPACKGGPENCAICSSQIKPFIAHEIEQGSIKSDEVEDLESKSNFDPRWDALKQFDPDQ